MVMAHPIAWAQRVVLQGKDFALDGEPFYPVVCNFSTLYTHPAGVPASATSLFYSMDGSWGPSGGFDCTDGLSCRAELEAAFAQVRDMGFNTLRIVGSTTPIYHYVPALGPGERRLSLVSQRITDGQRQQVHLQGPGFTDAVSIRHFAVLGEILDVAEAVGLQVILLCMGPSPNGEPVMYPAYDQQAVDDVAAYLGRLTEELGDHPALMALDLFNEPQLNRMEFQGGGHTKWRKQDICAFTSQWYSAIKEVSPKTLVTLGGEGLHDLEVWDVAALKLDFYSLHIYPEGNYREGWTSPAEALTRYQGRLHAFGRICPMPWIIGETGFSANDRTTEFPHTGVEALYHTWPWMHGTEAEQAAFATSSLTLSRACGASGWSWWGFQEFRWYNVTDPEWSDVIKPKDILGMYYGLLYLGTPMEAWPEKPAVDAVQTYVPSPRPEAPGAQPANYYDPYGFGTPVWLSGSVVDQDGEPLETVYVRLWCESDELDPLPGGETSKLESAHYTYTDQTGSFVFRMEPTTMGYQDPIKKNLIFSGAGLTNQEFGIWFGTMIPNMSVHEMDRTAFAWNELVDGLDIESHSAIPVVDLHGWSDLEVVNIMTHPTPDPGATFVDIAARYTVHAGSEFHAAAGSEVHIHTADVFPPCDGPGFRQLLQQPTTVLSTRSLMDVPAYLELAFAASTIPRIRPNPFVDEIEVLLDDPAPLKMQLMDGLGRVQKMGILSQAMQYRLQLDGLAPGAYYLHLQQGTSRWSYTVIKQP